MQDFLLLYLTMQTVLVTGANGFVGSYIVTELLEQGYRVIASGSADQHITNHDPNFCYQRLNFTNGAEVAAVFSKWKPDVVVHSGAMSKPDDCELNKQLAFSTNVEGTKHLLAHSSPLNAHFIFLSTDFVFDGKKGMYKEEDERSPVNYYGETKLLAEDITMNYSAEWSIVRTILVYGQAKGAKESFLESVVRAAKEHKPLRIFNDQVRMPTYVGDLAKGIAAIITKKANGIYHLSGKDAMTVYEAACKATAFNGLDTSLIAPILEGDLLAPAKRPKRTGFELTKAKNGLGYEPVDFLEGLRKTFASNEQS